MTAAGKPLVAPEVVKTFRRLLLGLLILFAAVAIVVVALQLPFPTSLLVFLVAELVIGAAYGMAMSVILRRVAKNTTPRT